MNASSETDDARNDAPSDSPAGRFRDSGVAKDSSSTRSAISRVYPFTVNTAAPSQPPVACSSIIATGGRPRSRSQIEMRARAGTSRAHPNPGQHNCLGEFREAEEERPTKFLRSEEAPCVPPRPIAGHTAQDARPGTLLSAHQDMADQAQLGHGRNEGRGPDELKVATTRTPLNFGSTQAKLHHAFSVISEMVNGTAFGLPRREIEDLPAYSFNPDESYSDEVICLMCMYHFKALDMVRVPPCSYEFHASCVDKWLEVNVRCPVCRMNASDTDP
ncbi:hypothetical protein HPB48_001216 [Haemaphysalis longicornis]|uniref:RING-type domain-containing protein n=1 Tax=Haemaphysalis longicornis TaxID=44386 RepID=A0A9J6FIN9_HAELO|nr:hypothetical protein HPB48_001216 [Haemaphysalis longicornis]